MMMGARRTALLQEVSFVGLSPVRPSLFVSPTAETEQSVAMSNATITIILPTMAAQIATLTQASSADVVLPTMT